MAKDDTKIKTWPSADELALFVYTAMKEFLIRRIIGKSQGRFENPARVDFLYRRGWCLKSEVQCLNCR